MTAAMRRNRRKPPPPPQPPAADVAADADTDAVAGAGVVATSPAAASSTPTTNETAPPSAVPWGQSDAKQKLKLLLEDEKSWVYDHFDQSNQAKSIEVIRQKDGDFAVYKKQNFYSNFRTLKSSVDIERTCVQFDRMGFEKEQEKWPITDTLPSGKKRWQGSDAQKLLREDIKVPGKKNWKPKKLFESRIEYKSWSLVEFRNFLYEEKKWETQGVYWQAQRNMEMRKQRVEEEAGGELVEEDCDMSIQVP